MLVYIFDDDKFHLDNVREAFLSFNNNKKIDVKIFNVKHKYDIEQLEEEIISNKPHVIIADQGLPYKDGSTLIKKVKEVYRPITILNSSIYEMHKEEFDYVFPKPTNLRMMIETINIIYSSFELGVICDVDNVISEFKMKCKDKDDLRKIVKAGVELKQNEEKVTYDKISEKTHILPRTISNVLNRIIELNALNTKSKKFLNNILDKSQRFIKW